MMRALVAALVLVAGSKGVVRGAEVAGPEDGEWVHGKFSVRIDQGIRSPECRELIARAEAAAPQAPATCEIEPLRPTEPGWRGIDAAPGVCWRAWHGGLPVAAALTGGAIEFYRDTILRLDEIHDSVSVVPTPTASAHLTYTGTCIRQPWLEGDRVQIQDAWVIRLKLGMSWVDQDDGCGCDNYSLLLARVAVFDGTGRIVSIDDPHRRQDTLNLCID